MKSTYLVIILILFSRIAFGQEPQGCEKIIFSDTLFNKPISHYDFGIVTGNIQHNIRREDIQDINDVITIDGDCLKFKISYGCGCGTIEKKLVTTGILQQGNMGSNFYIIKLYFVDHDLCKAGCSDDLSFDISQLKNNQNTTFIKFLGFDQLIKYN